MNEYYEQWAENAGIIYDEITHKPRETSRYDRKGITQPQRSFRKGAYMAGGGLVFSGATYAFLSWSDGPLPIGDYLGMRIAPASFRLGMKGGAVIHDIIHD